MELVDLKQSELKEINGGGIGSFLGKAYAELCCAVGCAGKAFYDYFDGAPSGMQHFK